MVLREPLPLTVEPPPAPEAKPEPRAVVLERVLAARAREREALAGLERALRSAEGRYLLAGRRFQDFEASFEARRATLLLRERHGA